MFRHHIEYPWSRRRWQVLYGTVRDEARGWRRELEEIHRQTEERIRKSCRENAEKVTQQTRKRQADRYKGRRTMTKYIYELEMLAARRAEEAECYWVRYEEHINRQTARSRELKEISAARDLEYLEIHDSMRRERSELAMAEFRKHGKMKRKNMAIKNREQRDLDSTRYRMKCVAAAAEHRKRTEVECLQYTQKREADAASYRQTVERNLATYL